MTRTDLTEEEWERLAPELPSSQGKRGGQYKPHRRVLNGILWIAKVEVPPNGVECRVTESDLMQNLDEKGQPKPTAQTPPTVEPFASPITGK